MARKGGAPFDSDEESAFGGGGDYEECPVCHQEFADGVCPIASVDCPYREGADAEEAEPDFEDVENLDALVGKDEEADKLTEEEVEFDEEVEEK